MASDCKVKDLPTLKREIRALLISSKHGCTPRQLQNDYLQMLGESIPYHFLGFSNFMDFIQSMPDVVSICRTRNNVTLYGVADSKTANIQKLVSKQRSRPGTCSSSHVHLNMVTKNYQPEPKEPEVPPIFKIRLKELMLSHPNGIALKSFNEAFAKRFHHYIAYHHWGFSSLEAMILSVPDILLICNDTTRNIKMVKRVIPQGRASAKKENPECDGGVNKKQGGREGPKEEESLHSLELSPEMKKKLMDEIKAPVSEKKTRKIPWTILEHIKCFLQANEAGIWVSRFLVQYKEFCGKSLDVRSLGYSSVVHMLHSVPCCALERPGGVGDWLVYLKGTKPRKVANNHQFHHSAYVSQELIAAIHRTLKGVTQGIPLSSFPKQFETVNECGFPVEEMGFSSSAELLQRVPGVQVVKTPDSDSVMVFSTWPHSEEEEEEEEEDGSKQKGKEGYCSAGKKEALKSQPSVYKGVALPKPSGSQFISVYVTEVRSPSSLFIQLIGKETTQVLECLQEDMTNFYRSKEGKSYTIEGTYPGQPCCASFNNDGYWYRAEVEKLVCADVVRIKYVDYGNIAELPITSIRQSRPNYLLLPAQAVQCRLCHLKPAGSAWSLRANQLLKQMTKDLPLVAVVTAIKNRMLSLYLVDTSTKRDVFINDALVNQGLALFEIDTPEDEVGTEDYSLQVPLEGGDGKSVPVVRKPKGPCVPPVSVPQAMPHHPPAPTDPSSEPHHPFMNQQQSSFPSQIQSPVSPTQQTTPIKPHPQKILPPNLMQFYQQQLFLLQQQQQQQQQQPFMYPMPPPPMLPPGMAPPGMVPPGMPPPGMTPQWPLGYRVHGPQLLMDPSRSMSAVPPSCQAPPFQLPPQQANRWNGNGTEEVEKNRQNGNGTKGEVEQNDVMEERNGDQQVSDLLDGISTPSSSCDSEYYNSEVIKTPPRLKEKKDMILKRMAKESDGADMLLQQLIGVLKEIELSKEQRKGEKMIEGSSELSASGVSSSEVSSSEGISSSSEEEWINVNDDMETYHRQQHDSSQVQKVQDGADHTSSGNSIASGEATAQVQVVADSEENVLSHAPYEDLSDTPPTYNSDDAVPTSESSDATPIPCVSPVDEATPIDGVCILVTSSSNQEGGLPSSEGPEVPCVSDAIESEEVSSKEEYYLEKEMVCLDLQDSENMTEESADEKKSRIPPEDAMSSEIPVPPLEEATPPSTPLPPSNTPVPTHEDRGSHIPPRILATSSNQEGGLPPSSDGPEVPRVSDAIESEEPSSGGPEVPRVSDAIESEEVSSKEENYLEKEMVCLDLKDEQDGENMTVTIEESSDEKSSPEAAMSSEIPVHPLEEATPSSTPLPPSSTPVPPHEDRGSPMPPHEDKGSHIPPHEDDGGSMSSYEDDGGLMSPHEDNKGSMPTQKDNRGPMPPHEDTTCPDTPVYSDKDVTTSSVSVSPHKDGTPSSIFMPSTLSQTKSDGLLPTPHLGAPHQTTSDGLVPMPSPIITTRGTPTHRTPNVPKASIPQGRGMVHYSRMLDNVRGVPSPKKVIGIGRGLSHGKRPLRQVGASCAKDLLWCSEEDTAGTSKHMHLL